MFAIVIVGHFVTNFLFTSHFIELALQINEMAVIRTCCLLTLDDESSLYCML